MDGNNPVEDVDELIDLFRAMNHTERAQLMEMVRQLSPSHAALGTGDNPL